MLPSFSQDPASIAGQHEAATRQASRAAAWNPAAAFAEIGTPYRSIDMDGFPEPLAASQWPAILLSNAARGAALNQLCHGTVIAAADGAILFANAAAERMAQGGGLVLSQGALTCADPRDAARLASLIQSAAAGGPGGCTRISRGPKRLVLAATVSPLPVSLEPGVDTDWEGQPLALVMLRDLGATSDAGQAHLIELFGLTGAEAAIVPQLLEGDSMTLIAQTRGVSAATVRAQAAKLLEKTGASNLRALASMIAALGCG